jgi:hypothetical protein
LGNLKVSIFCGEKNSPNLISISKKLRKNPARMIITSKMKKGEKFPSEEGKEKK